MSGPTSRGTHVSITRALFRGPDFQKLPPTARWTFVVLKSNVSGMAGIDNIYPAELAARLEAETGWAVERVTEDLIALESGGWIRREGSVVWVVDHLTFDPYAHVKDVKKRKAVQQHVAGLPRLPIVRTYVQHHAEWFPAGECAESHLDWTLPENEESKNSLRRLSEESANNSNSNSNSNSNNTNNSSALRIARGGKTYTAQFQQLWEKYPRRSGANPKDRAASQVEARLREGVTFELLLQKTVEYNQWATATGKVATEKVMQAVRFYGTSREFETGNWSVAPANGSSRDVEFRKRGYV